MAKILLVDDEESVLKSVGVLLKTEGHDVTPVHESDKAVDLIRTESYDLMITDIRMAPVDGMELMRIAHDERPNMPLIVISAYAAEKTATQSYDLGCTAYIKKPFKIQEVLDAVHTALESDQA